jgi:translation initiation factor 2 beta subunit (eIF-2beta)/eIF-5
MDNQSEINDNFLKMLNEVYVELDKVTTNSSKLIIPDPVIEKSTTNTYWKNVKKILQSINRPPDHFIEFLNKSLKTGDWISNSKSDGIVMIGKFTINQIMHVISEYIKKYVICNICYSTNTIMDKNKELRSYYICCNKCKSQYSIN